MPNCKVAQPQGWVYKYSHQGRDKIADMLVNQDFFVVRDYRQVNGRAGNSDDHSAEERDAGFCPNEGDAAITAITDGLGSIGEKPEGRTF